MRIFFFCFMVLIVTEANANLRSLSADQLFHTMSDSAGGVLSRNLKFLNVYNQVKETLGSSNEIEKIDADFNKGLLKLSFVGCSLILKSERRRGLKIFSGAKPDTKLEEYRKEEKRELIQNMSYWLWGHRLEEERLEEMLGLAKLVSKSNISKENELSAICSSFYLSANFYLY